MNTDRRCKIVYAAVALALSVCPALVIGAPPARRINQVDPRTLQQQQLMQQQQYQQQQQILQQQQAQQQQQARQAGIDTTQLDSANTEANKARAELKKAQAALAAASRQFDKSIDAKPDVQVAARELKAAQDALQSAMAKATESLKSNPAYQKAVTEAREAHAQVDAVRGSADATPEQRYAAATTAMTANKAVSSFESTALTGNTQVLDARAKLTASSEALHKLRDSYATAMHADPAWQGASKDVETKQKDVETADAKVADARKAIADRLAGRAPATAAPATAMAPNGPATQPAH